MAWPPVPAMATRAEQFDELVLDAASRMEHHAGAALGNLEFAVEDVPPSDPAPWESSDVPLGRLFAVAEAYPQLQASQNYLQLQGELVDTEDKIQASRRFYNGGVRELNTKIKIFPNTLFARNLGFHEREFFEVADAASIAEPPRVQF